MKLPGLPAGRSDPLRLEVTPVLSSESTGVGVKPASPGKAHLPLGSQHVAGCDSAWRRSRKVDAMVGAAENVRAYFRRVAAPWTASASPSTGRVILKSPCQRIADESFGRAAERRVELAASGVRLGALTRCRCRHPPCGWANFYVAPLRRGYSNISCCVGANS
jgi:hypothetical protein